MPYNTRRKSLSLTELGIVIPKRARAACQHASTASVAPIEGPPVKRSKTSHDGSASPPTNTTPMSPPRSTVVRIKDEQPLRPMQPSPPPSPRARGYNRVDLEGVNDDIVIATIRQLESTGNRPLFVRELGAILAQSLHCVEKSANPTALISSRLTQYLGRTWPSISPCPLAKDLSTSHPRRLYFYLTTMPRQPVPDVTDSAPKIKRIISPSLSSASAVDEEERYFRQRTALSPSPEVDLSSPELDDDSDESAPLSQPFSGRSSFTRASSTSSHMANERRAASPQLEKEERDFKQTANALYEQAQQRRKSNESQDVAMDEVDADLDMKNESVNASIEGDEGVNDATMLFGHLKSPSHQQMGFSSPVIGPRFGKSEALPAISAITVKSDSNVLAHSQFPRHNTDTAPCDSIMSATNASMCEASFSWETLQSPESIELDELDDMFEAYC